MSLIILNYRQFFGVSTIIKGFIMKIQSYTDLPIGKELFLGPKHQNFCNRYLRRPDGLIEVQNIYRYAKSGETQIMTGKEFDAWRDKV